jgi:hypothetical protein
LRTQIRFDERRTQWALIKGDSRRWRQQIRELFNVDWDPIGNCPDDEYDAYVDKVAAMIRDDATDDELIAYLRWVETVHMGLPVRPDLDTRLRKVVDGLRAIGFMN